MLISIIIPSYNSSKTISLTLKSIKDQSFISWECIIIDGNSTDDTMTIVNNYINGDERFIIVSEKDKGIYDAMNKGWNLAKGEWILFLGSDDTLEINSLQVLNAFLSDEYDIIYGNYNTIDINNNKKNMISLDYHCIHYKVFSNHQAVIMKRNVIEELGGFNINYKITADFDLIQRAYIAHYKFKQIPVTISNFYLGGISSNNLNTYIEWWKVCKNNNSIKFPIIVLILGIIRFTKKRILNIFKAI